MKLIFIKPVIIVFIFMIYNDVRCDILKYLACEPSYYIIANYYPGKDTKQIYFKYGYNRESPQRFFTENFFNIGIGEIWRGRMNEFYANFNLASISATIGNFFIYDSVTEHSKNEEYGWSSHVSRLNVGLVLFDFYKDYLYSRKINWIGLSGAFIIDKRTTVCGGVSPSTISPAISPQAVLYQFLGLSNIRHGDEFGDFGRQLKNNNFGLESKTSLQLGLLFRDKFFIGLNCGLNAFFSDIYPVYGTRYGCRVYYSPAKNTQINVFGYCYRGLQIYLDFNNIVNEYSGKPMEFNKIEFGVGLFNYTESSQFGIFN